MRAAPLPSPEETRDNRTFEALLWALSRPGDLRHLPEAGLEAPFRALIDGECDVYTDDPDLARLIRATGARAAEQERADHVFLASAPGPELFDRVRFGSDLYPDDGATVMFPTVLEGVPTLRLSGPGIDGSREVAVPDLPPAFWSRRADVVRYPMGVDLFLIDGDRVLGVPRSTTVEVL